MSATAVVWFRRDLRLHDHPALVAALADHERAIPLYVLDDKLLHGRYASPARARFLLGCLHTLDEDLRALGSGLVIRHGAPEQEVVAVAQETGAQTVLWTSDVAPYARRRDRRVTEALRDGGIEAQPHGGGYLVDPSRPRTQGGKPYAVFTPFWRAIADMERRPVHRAPTALPPLPSGLRKGRLPSADTLNINNSEVPEPVVEPGEAAARAALERWLRSDLDRYAERHDAL
jgi:deoxyribodipyrimidine photo-lyase